MSLGTGADLGGVSAVNRFLKGSQPEAARSACQIVHTDPLDEYSHSFKKHDAHGEGEFQVDSH